MDRPVWEGIYKDIHEVKAPGNGFHSSCWVNNSKVKVEKYLAGINENNPIPLFLPRSISLPLLAAMFKKNRGINQIVIDFGGGLEFSCLSFVQSCAQTKRIIYLNQQKYVNWAMKYFLTILVPCFLERKLND